VCVLPMGSCSLASLERVEYSLAGVYVMGTCVLQQSCCGNGCQRGSDASGRLLYLCGEARWGLGLEINSVVRR
jgi:hypothetical protein